MQVTLTVYFIAEYKKADSPVNARIQDPDVSVIISGANIFEWFVFKCFIDFTVLESKF